MARTRRELDRAGCDLEIEVEGPPSWGAEPAIEVSRQQIHGLQAGRRGRLRIELGAGVHLGRMLVVEVHPTEDNRLVLGEETTIGMAVRLVLFGGAIEIGPRSRVRDGAMLKSSGALRAGEGTIVQNGSTIHCAREVVLEDLVTIAERVTVIDSDHRPDGSDDYTQEQPLEIEPVAIGRNCWIGANSVILRGARLGRNAVVGAGSVVRAGDYPASWLLAGAPATPRRALEAAASVPAADPASRPAGGSG